MTEHRKTIFVSSVRKELQAERWAIKEFVGNDPLLRRFFEVFLFEDLPAQDRRADEVYLEEVGRCDIYLGLFGNEYGFESIDGVSPTELEFDEATAKGKPRLIFVKGADDKARHPKALQLIRKARSQLIRRRFAGIPDLTASLYASLVEHMEHSGDLRRLPFDASACERATMDDLCREKIKAFLAVARRERNYPLLANAGREKVLAHLNLVDEGRPNHAAVLLFSKEPQRFLITSEVKCLHFHGTQVRKPIPSYQIYKGTVFELVDQALDFVLSKINRRIGTREHSVQAPVDYELPLEAVREAIVNAVAHRDYTSNASVQVMLFADRLEVWNPGELPPPLTPALLRQPHASIPRNPLIAEPLYLARYIEKAGSGTLDMIERCRDISLPEPDFEQRAGQWVVTLWRDWLTAQVMTGLGLSDRQTKAVTYVKVHGRITNSEYQVLAGIIRKTAARDLDDLVAKDVLKRVGSKRGVHYVLARKK
ncbi:MAG: ATP-binding protein [Desulfovibrionales bacterium]|nr:ATP-binding protein [Desulfovibrionales bacterium]